MAKMYTHTEMPGTFGELGHKPDGGRWSRREVHMPDGTSHPPSWFRTSSAQMISAAGFRVKPEPEPEPPTPEQIEGMRDSAKARFASWADNVLRSQAGIVPDAEKLSWTLKADVARAYQADPQSVSADDLAILQAEADVTGETLDALCPQIIAREAAYKPISGALAGYRRTIGAAIDAADTPEDIETAITDGLANAGATLAALSA